MFQKYLSQFETKALFPEGTEIFLGVTLVRKGDEWMQKSAFAKVQGLNNTYSKKKVDTTKYKDAKDIAESLVSIKAQEMGDDEW